VLIRGNFRLKDGPYLANVSAMNSNINYISTCESEIVLCVTQ